MVKDDLGGSRLVGRGSQTQVPWCAGGAALRFFSACDLSLKSVGFCWETSIKALATMTPGGMREGVLRRKK